MEKTKPVESIETEGKYPRVTVRMPQHLLDKIDRICEKKPDIKTRSAGIKWLINKGLDNVSV